jgi:hypothetical protein
VLAGDRDKAFRDAIANAEEMYQAYLAEARLTDVSGIVSYWWAQEAMSMADGRELLDFSPRSSTSG